MSSSRADSTPGNYAVTVRPEGFNISELDKVRKNDQITFSYTGTKDFVELQDDDGVWGQPKGKIKVLSGTSTAVTVGAPDPPEAEEKSYTVTIESVTEGVGLPMPLKIKMGGMKGDEPHPRNK